MGKGNVRAVLAMLLCAALAQACSGGNGGSGDAGTGARVSAAPSSGAYADGSPANGLSGYGSAVIDGVLSPGEWDNAARLDFNANVPANDGGGTTPATLLIMNDGSSLYLAVTIERASFGGATNPGFEFDNDNDGVREDGDDGFGMAVGIYQPVTFFDGYRYTCPGAQPGTAGCSAYDDETSRGILPPGIVDGAAGATNDGSITVIELSHPLESGDLLHDFALPAGGRVGMRAMLRLFSLTPACNYGPLCYADTYLPSGQTYLQIAVASEAGQEPPAEQGPPAGEEPPSEQPPSEQAPPEQEPPAQGTLTVLVDIQPGDAVSSINPRVRGRVPVALLSSPEFDAAEQIDRTTLTFGRTGDEASLAFCSGPEDVNDDGLGDLVCHFVTALTGFQAGDTAGIVRGRTIDGSVFSGSDAVRIVPKGRS